jgi:hypothetical protein
MTTSPCPGRALNIPRDRRDNHEFRADRDFVLRVQVVKAPVAPERIYDFAPVKKIGAELAAEK